MKQLTKVLCVVMFSILGLSIIAKADYLDSAKKQDQFNDQIKKFLESNDLDQLKEYIDSIPDCDLEDNQIPEVCTLDRIDGKSYEYHVRHRRVSPDYANFTVVGIDAGIYDSLQRMYFSLYRKNYNNLDIDTYKSFYNRYRSTWLNERVEKTMMKLWQRGDSYNKYSNFSCLTGERIFTTLYMAHKFGLDPYKYVSKESNFSLNVPTAGRGRFHTILREMKLKSNKTQSPELLARIAGHWFNSLISPELLDETEQQYYKGRKQEYMYKMFNEEGFGMFIEAGLVPTDWQKHVITLNVKACRRVLQNERICSAFEDGATKYGFYVPPENITAQIEQEITDAIDQTPWQFDTEYLLM